MPIHTRRDLTWWPEAVGIKSFRIARTDVVGIKPFMARTFVETFRLSTRPTHIVPL